ALTLRQFAYASMPCRRMGRLSRYRQRRSVEVSFVSGALTAVSGPSLLQFRDKGCSRLFYGFFGSSATGRSQLTSLRSQAIIKRIAEFLIGNLVNTEDHWPPDGLRLPIDFG